MEEDFTVFTTLRKDLLCLENPNLERLIEALKHFGWKIPRQLLELKSWELFLEQQVQESSFCNHAPLRIRVDVDKNQNMKTSMDKQTPTTIEKLYPQGFPHPHEVDTNDLYTIVLDDDVTVISEFTCFKTSFRKVYDVARSRMSSILVDLKMNKSPNSEILIQNQRGEVTEGSITNVYFWRNDKWVTPVVGSDHGGLDGVARRWALNEGLCSEIEIVKRDDVENGEILLISNGLRGFNAGRVWTV